MKTRAAVLREIGADWSVEEIELDEPKAGEILVKTTAAGMCHSDEHAHDGTMPVPLPIIGGHEGAGVVIGLGPGVTEFEVGDHISCSFIPSCGKCTWCARGQQNLCDLLDQSDRYIQYDHWSLSVPLIQWNLWNLRNHPNLRNH